MKMYDNLMTKYKMLSKKFIKNDANDFTKSYYYELEKTLKLLQMDINDYKDMNKMIEKENKKLIILNKNIKKAKDKNILHNKFNNRFIYRITSKNDINYKNRLINKITKMEKLNLKLYIKNKDIVSVS